MSDKGAHFRRCDFQVHTPRDNQWKGARPTSDMDRAEYAGRFVAACREKGLDAVAITDHHDFVMFPYIRAAALAECGEDGELLPAELRLVVFPGLELTLAVPCQAILILDADLPGERLGDVLSALTIEPVSSDAGALPSTTPLAHIDSLQKLHELLDLREWIKGRYIVLPNVTDNGHQTLMRSGMAPKYRDMPCVGGYLDGTVDKIGQGNRDIFAGKDKSRGNKRLAVFQTSDARSEDFAKLGAPSTFVKWAEPTAEALRQACLAEESRISHDHPDLPSIYISAIRVSNSKFLGPIDLEFNRQYSAIIGGRGTGKSTILDYLRWALCDQSSGLPTTDEAGDPELRQRRLIETTLVPVAAVVDVHFVVNDIPHVVRRHSSTQQVELKIGNQPFEKSREADIRDLLPVQAYSQKQLSSVSVRIDELTRFVTSPIRRQLGDIDRQFADLASRLREQYSMVQRCRRLDQTIERATVQERSLAEQARNLRQSLGGLSDSERATMDLKASYDAGQSATEAWLETATRAVSLGERLSSQIGDLVAALPSPPPLTAELDPKLQARFESTRQGLQKLQADIEQAVAGAGGTMISSSDESIERAFADFANQYSEVKARSTTHSAKLAELAEVERLQLDATRSLQTQRVERDALGEPAERLAELRQEMLTVVSGRADTVEAQCASLSLLSGGLLRASLRRGQGLGTVQDLFKGVVSGSGLRANKIEAVFESLATEDDPIATWDAVLVELESLTSADKDSTITTADAPVLGRLGLGTADLTKVALKITPDSWLSLALARIDDHPVFEYQTREGDFIDFDVASAGQQATALMRVLLAQAGPPLIVDQPEDDLDSQVVQDVVERIWKAKFHRQLIFASHNANLVVNGDAELVVCCDYRTAGDQSGGKIKIEGAIDMAPIRDEITNIMEGGEKAFKLRKAKYGF